MQSRLPRGGNMWFRCTTASSYMDLTAHVSLNGRRGGREGGREGGSHGLIDFTLPYFHAPLRFKNTIANLYSGLM